MRSWKPSTMRIPPFSWCHHSNISWSQSFSVLDHLIENLSTLMVSVRCLTSCTVTDCTWHVSVSLVGCFVVLTAFSAWVLLAPSKTVALILDVIDLTYRFRFELLAIVIVNILSSFAFERYAERPIARLVGNIKKWWSGRRGGNKHRRRIASGKVYKTIEGNL
jgi:hypothetical protein